MKGLAEIPSLLERQHAYDVLQSSGSILNVRKLALFSQWARLDARLAEILVGHLAKHWREIALGSLLDALGDQPWPRAILVLLRFAELSLPAEDRSAIRLIIKGVEDRFRGPSESQLPELFFIPLSLPNPVVLRNEVERRSKPYVEFGFIGSQSLLSHGRAPQGRTLLSQDRRLRILKAIFERQSRVTVSDYIEACGGMVSRRQAQRDLDAFDGATSTGFTRGRVYLKV